jgi:hypothetical protein
MHSSSSSTFKRLSIAAALLLGGCPPATASCPAGSMLASDGRCIAAGDGGPMADGSVGDTGVHPMIDAGPGADGCALHTYYTDSDGDGHGDIAGPLFACEMPTGAAATGDDCNDSCAACHPGAVEVCEGMLDENCDGQVDEGISCSCTNGATQPCGTSSTAPCHMGTQTCLAGVWGTCTGNVEPIAETCNGIDDDCDGTVDDGLTIPLWYTDADGDGHGVPGTTMMACTMPTGYASSSDDCDDTTAGVHPGASEVCDGRDNDCNASADETFACVLGSATMCTTSCGSMGTGFCSASCAAPTGTACNVPTETCNGLDENCDGVADEGLGMLSNRTIALAAGGAPATDFQGVQLVPTATGFMLFAQNQESPTHITMQAIQANGMPTGTAMPLGTGFAPASAAPFTVHAAGPNFLIGWGYLGAGSTGTITLGSVNASGGMTMNPAALTLTGTTGGHTRVVIADATATSATLYAAVRTVATPVVYSIRRFTLNISGLAGPSVTAQMDVVAGIAGSDAFDIANTTTGDYIAYEDSAGSLRLAFAPSSGGAATLFTPAIGTSANAVGVAIAVGDRTAGIAAGNPLGVAWQDTTSEHFVEIRSTSGTMLTLGTPVALAGGTGRSVLFPPPSWVDIVAVPNGTTETHSGHWLVAASDTMGAGSIERAWEILGASGTPTATAFTIATTVGAAGDLSIAVGASGLRLGHASTMGAAVTRAIGCR